MVAIGEEAAHGALLGPLVGPHSSSSSGLAVVERPPNKPWSHGRTKTGKYVWHPTGTSVHTGQLLQSSRARFVSYFINCTGKNLGTLRIICQIDQLLVELLSIEFMASLDFH